MSNFFSPSSDKRQTAAMLYPAGKARECRIFSASDLFCAQFATGDKRTHKIMTFYGILCKENSFETL